MSDMDKMIAKVEYGDWGGEHAAAIGPDVRARQDAYTAYNGSLDAAKRLHDALLPGWDYLISASDAEIWPTGAVLHVDHIQAVSKGGTTELKNLQTLCSACNHGKGAR